MLPTGTLGNFDLKTMPAHLVAPPDLVGLGWLVHGSGEGLEVPG